MSDLAKSAARRRALSAVVAASMAVGLTISSGAAPAAAVGATELAGLAAPPPAHAFSTAWSAGNWASTNGNMITDVAKTIGATSPAASGLTGKGVGIALIDTGVISAAGLPAAQVVNGPDLSFDSQATNLRYLDTFGHGTHLAGIMIGNDSSAGLKGIAPGAKLTSVKVGASGGVVDVMQVIAALNWVVAHRNDDPANPIKVINLAYGTDADYPDESKDPLLFAVEQATKAGILVVVAAGNYGTAPNQLTSPALDEFVLSVGSADTKGTISNADDELSTFSSSDTEHDIRVVAPGEGIVSLRNQGSAIDQSFPGARVGTTLFRGSGTSQASAVVSAAAALLFQKAPKATPYQIQLWIETSAKPLTGVHSNRTKGEIDLANALTMSVPTGTDPDTNYSSGLGSIEAARGSVHVVHNSANLTGESDIFGPFDLTAWAAAVKKNTAWNGGVWMGRRLAGDGWTGSSWASKTWAGATWAGKDWANQAWPDPSWTSHTWSGRYWSGGTWSGRYWSSSTWETKVFASQSFASAGWF